MKIALYLAILTTPTIAFQCFQCNNGIDEDDSKPCIDQETDCPSGTKGCSAILYASGHDDKIHMRKFCTISSTILPRYLRLFRNSTICQNIFTNQGFTSLLERQRREALSLVSARQHVSLLERRHRQTLPPAPPRQYKNNILCICTESLCNGGDIHKETIIDKIISDPPKHNIDFSLDEFDE